MFARLLQQVIPEEDVDGIESSSEKRTSAFIERPPFSLPLMTYNFRNFNARCGISFILVILYHCLANQDLELASSLFFRIV